MNFTFQRFGHFAYICVVSVHCVYYVLALPCLLLCSRSVLLVENRPVVLCGILDSYGLDWNMDWKLLFHSIVFYYVFQLNTT